VSFEKSELLGEEAACEKCGTSGGCECGDDGCGCVGDWRDNTELWFGGDAYKSLGDRGTPGFNPNPFGLQNSFGLVGGFNTGLALGESRVRAQVGASYGAYDWKGRTTLAPLKNDSLEQQSYLTMGFYKRGDVSDDDRISWGLVYDYFYARNWGWANNPTSLSQFRGLAGYALNECHELGFWGTVNSRTDTARFTSAGAARVNIRAMTQANVYWKYNWAFGGTTTAYLGGFDRADVASWQFGLLGQAPLSNNVALYGNYTYVAPGSGTGLVGSVEEQWNVSAGLAFYLGGKASSRTVSGHAGMPLLPVANNGSFLITD
ncbi:MAG: DUF6666 family protein, partial [Myxococcaceae bacterium]